MSKKFKYVSVGLLLIVSVFGFSNLSRVEAQQAPTIAELLAQIADLQRQLAILQGQQNQTGAWCHTFNTNLSIGMRGSEVSALHYALEQADLGLSLNEFGSYGEDTASAVSGFQEKYRREILTPLRLTNPTGYVGPSTRAVLNRLYGCDKNRIDRTPDILAPTVVPRFDPPTITSASSKAANFNELYAGELGYVSGKNFLPSNTVYLKGDNHNNWSIGARKADDQSIFFTIPSISPNGSYYLTVINTNGTSNSLLVSVINNSQSVPPPPSSSEPALRGFRMRVADRATGAGLSGVEVRIERDSAYVASPATGSDGYIATIPLRVGDRHTFSFSKTGYQNRSAIALTIPAGTGTYTYGTIWLEPETTTPPPVSTPSPAPQPPPTTATHWISSLVGPNGVISPVSANVEDGGSQTFTITPNSGYQVSQVLVNSSSVGPVTSYTFSNIRSSQTIQASFSQITSPPVPTTYNLNISTTGVLGAGSGTVGKKVAGTGDPGPYAAGTIVTLTATPDAGSTFLGWNGSLTHTVSPTTITMDGNKSVTAIFAAVTTPPPPEVTLRGVTIRVTNPTYISQSGVTVRIERGTTYVATQMTGSDGYTPVISLRVGESHTFRFSKTGYQSQSIMFTIPSGSSVYTYGPVILRSS